MTSPPILRLGGGAAAEALLDAGPAPPTAGGAEAQGEAEAAFKSMALHRLGAAVPRAAGATAEAWLAGVLDKLEQVRRRRRPS